MRVFCFFYNMFLNLAAVMVPSMFESLKKEVN